MFLRTKNRAEEQRKNDSKILRFLTILEELEHENWRGCRSTTITSDLWTKTTKNSTNPEIQIRAIFGAKFLGKFLGEFGEIGGSNSWQPLL